MNETFKFLKENTQVNYLATVKGDKPSCRPFGDPIMYDGKIYVITSKHKEVSKQIAENNNVCIVAYDDENWIRINCQLIDDSNNVAVKQAVINEFDWAIEAGYTLDNPDFQILYMANVDAIVRSFEKDKYMFVMPKKYLPQLQENKFALLDEVKAINIGNDLPLTLSISLGTEYSSFLADFEAARSAMELALGRGGDQVVLKSNDKITYYGGRSQGTEKSTRVKARVKTLAFKELLETKEKVIIMAHKDPDMDAFGSAIGVYRMVNSMNKEAHIVINEVSSAISPIYGNFTANSMYGDDMIINNEQAIEMINADTMLVVVDVNNPSLTECEELISYAKTVVVFDHHRQTKDVIANATLSYVEPFASSACEMIAEMLQYMDEKIKLRPSEADAMYAGILIDTDNFLTKTGVRTFEAAAYLRRSGADVMRVRKMFRSDIDTYRQKADGVRNAEMVLGMFAVSVFEPKEGPESPTVLTAKVANEMLNIAGVRASFVIAQLGENVKISARSIDDVNVQIIMERMGGGGHANIAAAQFKNTTKEKVKKQLVNLLEEMYKEGDI